MQLVITERQFKKLASQFDENELIDEQDAGDAAPEAGTSSDGEVKTGASKWESGVTRGPGNQIGVTKWSETVGSKITRGKANPLSEQAKAPKLKPKFELKPETFKASSDYFATVDSYNKRKIKDLIQHTTYVYKQKDGENFFVNLVKGQTEEALLDLREFLMSDVSIGVEVFVGTVFSETVVVPVAIVALNALVLLNDINLYTLQGDKDEEALIRIIEDVLVLSGMGLVKVGSMGLKAWLKNRSNLRKLIALKGILNKTIQYLTNLVKTVKLPTQLKNWMSSKINLFNRLPQIIDNIVGRVKTATPNAVIRYASTKFNKALFAGFMGYIGAKALNKLLKLPPGTVENEAKTGNYTETTEKAFNSLQITDGEKQLIITNQNELDEYKKSNNRKAITKKVAEVNAKAYPCLLTYYKNGKFEVQLTSNKGYIYKINNVQYYVDKFGIYNVDTNESFNC